MIRLSPKDMTDALEQAQAWMTSIMAAHGFDSDASTTELFVATAGAAILAQSPHGRETPFNQVYEGAGINSILANVDLGTFTLTAIVRTHPHQGIKLRAGGQSYDLVLGLPHGNGTLYFGTTRQGGVDIIRERGAVMSETHRTTIPLQAIACLARLGLEAAESCPDSITAFDALKLT